MPSQYDFTIFPKCNYPLQIYAWCFNPVWCQTHNSSSFEPQQTTSIRPFKNNLNGTCPLHFYCSTSLQLFRTDRSDSTHVAAQSNHRLLHFRNPWYKKETKFIWSPIFKVSYNATFLHSYRLTKDKKERSKATRSSNHVNVYAINKHLWWKLFSWDWCFFLIGYRSGILCLSQNRSRFPRSTTTLWGFR